MPIIEPKILKGFRDFGPKEQPLRQKMFVVIQSVFERFGFLPLSTPALEYKEILMGKYGEDEKLVYQFTDNGGREVALRYDLTVPLARYVALNQNQLVFPFKRYQIAPVWRADNPQKGRFREFYQCDVDVVGTTSPLADAEVMACLCKAIEELGIRNYELRINDRNEMQFESVETLRALDKLDKLGADSVLKLLAEKKVPQSDVEKIRPLLLGGNFAVPSGVANLMALISGQGVAEKNIKYAPSIARGLDYYTGTVFEIVLKDRPEFGSIVGGGRYDNLADQFSKKSLPAVGGSIGIDRLFEAAQSLSLIRANGGIRVLVLNLSERYSADYLSMVTQLRNAGIDSEVYLETAKLGKQLKYAESKGARFAALWGEKEKAQGAIEVKNLATREQESVPFTDLVEFLKTRLKDEKK